MLTIAHATALSPEDDRPFEHGVALARRAGAKLCSIHAGTEPISEMPAAEALLRRWAVDESIDHDKIVHNCCEDPVDTVLDALRKVAPDLVLCATHQRHGLLRILADSRAESLAENLKMPTLLFPIDAPGFVASDSGAISLRRIVIPVGDAEAAEAAVERAAWLGDLVGADELELVLLHVGPGDAPKVDVPLHEGWTWRAKQAEGHLEDVVAEAAAESGPGCVVVMATRGRDSIVDALVGSHTERVLRRAQCPLLMVPLPG
jgi:nucleotide-binding universal stress UspA family protein